MKSLAPQQVWKEIIVYLEQQKKPQAYGFTISELIDNQFSLLL